MTYFELRAYSVATTERVTGKREHTPQIARGALLAATLKEEDLSLRLFTSGMSDGSKLSGFANVA